MCVLILEARFREKKITGAIDIAREYKIKEEEEEEKKKVKVERKMKEGKRETQQGS